MKKDKKSTILLVLLTLSLCFNIYLLLNLNKDSDETTNKIIERYLEESPGTEDYTLIKTTLENFSKDTNHVVVSESGQDVTKKHEVKLLDFYKNQDYKAAKDYILKENISIGYSDDSR